MLVLQVIRRSLGYAAASFEVLDRPKIEDILSGIGSLAGEWDLNKFIEHKIDER